MIPAAIEYELTTTCPNCGDTRAIHKGCGKCFACCTCIPCIECATVTRHICNRCVKCIDHCQCIRCTGCGALTNSIKDICTSCGNGISGFCGCCGGSGKVFRHDEVNLLALVPKNSELEANPSPRLISNEIEICGVEKTTCSLVKVFADYHCSVVHDGSLPDGGFEINTHPAGGDLYLQLIHDIGKALSGAGAYVNERAGCHTHVDARDLGYNELALLCKIYACSEIALYSLLPQIRRGNKFCKISGMDYMQLLLKDDKIANLDERQAAYRSSIMKNLYGENKTASIKHHAGSKSASNRYRGLNLHSWFHRGTIEFRIPPGMTSPRYITYWGMLLCRIVDEAKEMNSRTLQLLEETIPHIVKNVNLANGMITYTNSVPSSITGAMDIVRASQELLLHFAPSSGISDWLKSCFKAYNKGTDVPSY